MMPPSRRSTLAAAVLLALAPAAFAQEPGLTGDWFGFRESLGDEGVTWHLSSVNLAQGVLAGGLSRGSAAGGRVDAYLNLDGEKLGAWKGLFVTLHGEALYGTSVNARTGALGAAAFPLIFPNDDPPSAALTAVRVQQYFGDNFMVFGGRINTLDDYARAYRGDARGADGFANGSFLFPPVLGRTIPYVAYAAGFVVLDGKTPLLAVVAFDTTEAATVVGLRDVFRNGVAINAESFLPTKFFGLPGHQVFGGAYSTGRYTALDPEPYLVNRALAGYPTALPSRSGSWSLYYGFDQALWADGADESRTLGVFGSAGISDGNPNPIRWSADVGVGGAVPGTKRDTFGVGYFYLGMSGELKSFTGERLPVRDEHGVEAWYKFGVTPWLEVSPDVQVITPVRATAEAAVAVAVRARLVF